MSRNREFSKVLTFVNFSLRNIKELNSIKLISMKTITKPLLFVGLSCVLMAASCKKTNFPPPDPFATLSNSLVCKINGSEWRSNERGGGFFLISGTGHEYIRLSFANGRQKIDFFINPPYDKPFYIFNQTTNTYPNTIYPNDYISFFKGYPDLTPSEEYVTNAVDTGRVDIVLMDPVSNKIKGKFFFTGKDNRTGNKTEGYFDYHQ
jgi:hypothetical protein